MDKKVRVLLVEDDHDFAFLIQKMLEKDERLICTGHAHTKEKGIETAQKQKPDIVVMDLNLSGGTLDGIEAAKEIRLTTTAKVLLLTSFEHPGIILDASKRAFASGYIFKSQCAALAETVYQTAVSNTPQETLIKELILAGLTPAERGILSGLISGEMDTQSSSSTVANQKTSIFKKLGVKNTSELISVFKAWG